jgi:alkylation response protein AidB-like acyl-CoA dehydrogenase
MNFALTSEQTELRDSVRRLLTAKAPSQAIRRASESEIGYDPALWTQMAEQLGLQSLAIPEEFGGAGFTFLELAIVCEEMGRAVLPSPFFSSIVLAANALLSCGDEPTKRDLLPSIADGGTIATLAWTEDSGSWDHDVLQTHASRKGDRWLITGAKNYVTDGLIAGLLLVTAQTDAGCTMFAVDGSAPGLTREPLEALDGTRRLAGLTFDEVPARLVGQEGGAGLGLAATLDLAAVALAAEQVGGARRCLEMAVDYAKTREQFGRPIGSFQALKHKCADILLQVESAWAAAYYAAWAASEGSDELPAAAHLAKAYCSEAYAAAAAENIQIHGGIGFTWEHDAHLYFKRARSSLLYLGDPTRHRELLADLVGV